MPDPPHPRRAGGDVLRVTAYYGFRNSAGGVAALRMLHRFAEPAAECWLVSRVPSEIAFGVCRTFGGSVPPP